MTTLAARLRSQTWPAHRQVEATTFVRALLGGTLERPAYCLLLANLHAIYAALEAALVRHAAHAAVVQVVTPALFRRDALASDLNFLHGPGWRETLPLQPAAVDYVRRLRELDRGGPDLLVAHAYVRYLGDLSGGQALQRVVARAFGLPGTQGTRFYDFGASAQVAELVRSFRDGLDRIGGDASACEAIVDEAADSFRRHERLFDELDRARLAPA